jgi:hypothetical protein
MGLFDKTESPAAKAEHTELERLAEEVAKMRGEVAGLRRERADLKSLDRLEEERITLRKQITDLEITQDRVKEQHAREKREVEHMVGLERNRQEVELQQAKRDTELRVREENLSADKDRFAAEITFQREHMQREVDRIERLMGEIVKRLPDISASLRFALPGQNGHRETADARAE